MAFTDTVSRGYLGNGATIANTSGTYTGDAVAALDTSVTHPATNAEIDLVFPHASIRSCVFSSDQDLTVKVNSSTMPDETFALKANIGFCWTNDCGLANPFTADVTKIFVTNAGTNDSALKIRVLYNL